jgi:hypothetical protein
VKTISREYPFISPTAEAAHRRGSRNRNSGSIFLIAG